MDDEEEQKTRKTQRRTSILKHEVSMSFEAEPNTLNNKNSKTDEGFLKKSVKSVKFDADVEVIKVESFKELNKIDDYSEGKGIKCVIF